MNLSSSDPVNPHAIRQQFPVLCQQLPRGRPVFLDSAASAQKPEVVIRREREVQEQYYANAYRGRYQFGARIDEELERSRQVIARFLGADSPECIAFTAGTTLGLNQVAFGWGRSHVSEGDEVVVTPMEHHANFVPWQQLAHERRARLKLWPMTDDGQLDMTPEASPITERTRIVAVCAMSNVLGTVNPVREIAQRAHDVGAVIVVDAAQSVPHGPTDVRSDGIDFLVFSGHKLYGPTGVGVICCRPDRAEELQPIVFGGHMISRVTVESSEWADYPARMEAGTLPIVQAIALGTAVDWVTEIGVQRLAEHEHHLLADAMERLQQIPGMTIFGPSADSRGAILSFRIDGLHPEDLAAMLDRRNVFTRHGHHCAMVLHDRLGVSATTRVSFAAYNTSDDVGALVEAIDFARQKLRLI